MDGNKITKSEVMMIASRVYDLNELCAAINVPYSITIRYEDLIYQDKHHHHLELMLWNNTDSSFEDSTEENFYEKLIDWEIKVRGLADTTNFDNVSNCIDRCIEDFDFSTGILLSRESFSNIFRECMQKFSEVKHE